jgi:protein-tyrosine phosphatase
MTDSPITSDNPFNICFVCLGNICRSPTAEGVFQHLVNQQGLQSYFYIDSAGTSAYHIGEPANSKSQQIANRKGIELKSRARRFESSDFNNFDLVIAMDDENYQNLKMLANGNNQLSKIKKLREFDPTPGDGNVPDPYYGGIDGFENVFNIVYRSSESLLNSLKNNIPQES